jgi:hypothetical protein
LRAKVAIAAGLPTSALARSGILAARNSITFVMSEHPLLGTANVRCLGAGHRTFTGSGLFFTDCVEKVHFD